MSRNPCLWWCLDTLNITISLSDLVSVFDFHPEWFLGDGICLEAVKAPQQRLGLYISHVPLSLIPQQVLNGSEEHCSTYILWRTNEGWGHYSPTFGAGDLCFEISDKLLLPGDLSCVFGSAKKKIILTSIRKDPPLFKRTALCRSESGSLNALYDEFSGDAGFEDMAWSDKSSTTSVQEKKTVLKERWYGSWKLPMEWLEDFVTPDNLTCRFNPREFTNEGSTDCWGFSAY